MRFTYGKTAAESTMHMGARDIRCVLDAPLPHSGMRTVWVVRPTLPPLPSEPQRTAPSRAPRRASAPLVEAGWGGDEAVASVAARAVNRQAAPPPLYRRSTVAWSTCSAWAFEARAAAPPPLALKLEVRIQYEVPVDASCQKHLSLALGGCELLWDTASAPCLLRHLYLLCAAGFPEEPIAI